MIVANKVRTRINSANGYWTPDGFVVVDKETDQVVEGIDESEIQWNSTTGKYELVDEDSDNKISYEAYYRLNDMKVAVNVTTSTLTQTTKCYESRDLFSLVEGK